MTWWNIYNTSTRRLFVDIMKLSSLQGQLICKTDMIKCKTKFINPLWPSDAISIWPRSSSSILDKMMTSCLTTPSHSLNQCLSSTRFSGIHSIVMFTWIINISIHELQWNLLIWNRSQIFRWAILLRKLTSNFDKPPRHWNSLLILIHLA